MHTPDFLAATLLFLLAIVIAVPLATRLRLSSVLGYLLAGMAIGPYGLGLLTRSGVIQSLAGLGVVLLLFLIGLELSPQRLWMMRRQVFGMGLAQVVLSSLLLGLAGYYGLGLGAEAATVIGIALALSSTAFGVQLLAERKDLGTRYGRLTLAVLLFQDLAVIPLLAVVPMLALGLQPSSFDLLNVLRVVGILALVILAGRFLLQPLFRMVARTRLPDVSTATALLLAFGMAWLVGLAGVSMSLGAFLAGMLLADSAYRHEIQSHIQPFKGLLLGLFFVAVGMSVDLRLIWMEPVMTLGLVLGLLVVKAPILALIGRYFGGLDIIETSRFTGLLASGGEFAFVILVQAHQVNLIEPAMHARLLLAITLSMALTPLLAGLVPRLCMLLWQPAAELPPHDVLEESLETPSRVILAGYGRVGQIVARVLHARGIPYTALEHSIEQVELSRRFAGARIFFGDPSRPELLQAAHIDQAEVFVLATDDPETNLRTAQLVRRLYPHLQVVARARNRQHAFRLLALQPDMVVRETFHSSLVMAQRVLELLGIDPAIAAQHIDRFREHDEKLLHEQSLLYDDEAALIQSHREAFVELETLFREDLEHQTSQRLPVEGADSD